VDRRQFVQGVGAAGLGLLAGCGRLPSQAPPPSRTPRLGYLSPGWLGDYQDAFRRGLEELGYVEGQNIVTEYRVTDGGSEGLAALAAELVSVPVDAIIAASAPAALAAKGATATIPIVVMASGDPVASGLVSSYARPDANLTGMGLLSGEVAVKRLQLLTQVVPGITRVAALADAGGRPDAPELVATQQGAQALGVDVQPSYAGGPDQLESVFAGLTTAGVQGIVVFTHALAMRWRRQIAALAAAHGLPAVYGARELVEGGGLMAYGPSFAGGFSRAAYYVDRLFKGAKPADLPVELPTTFDFVLNQKTARALGITFSPELLRQATEVLQ
jgi:putative ABC transport system substrate-binding protein